MDTQYKKVQAIAKETITYIKSQIRSGFSLKEIRRLCEEKMLQLGADSFWYWDVGAFVFSGRETTLSVSGKTYETSHNLIQENDIVTIDLSPQRENIWGDYARTVIVEDGNVVEEIRNIKNVKWREGLLVEEKLHEELLRFAKPDVTFEELYYHMNRFIAEQGYINLDFMGNLGHSIVKEKSGRIYIEKGNRQELGAVNFFTFEPHISRMGSAYGYKKENIYYFQGNELVEL